MGNQSLWQIFLRTGDPVYYMLYKALDARSRETA